MPLGSEMIQQSNVLPTQPPLFKPASAVTGSSLRLGDGTEEWLDAECRQVQLSGIVLTTLLNLVARLRRWLW